MQVRKDLRADNLVAYQFEYPREDLGLPVRLLGPEWVIADFLFSGVAVYIDEQ